MSFRLSLLTLCASLAWAAPPPNPDSSVARVVESKLLSPCCYRQAVAIHDSPTASSMRAEIEELAARGRTERQIIDLYKARYGMRILGEPEGPVWWVATLVPVVCLTAALFVLSYFLFVRPRLPMDRREEG